MPRPEQHTIVQFKLRSLLAVTFSICVVMAAASPWLRGLDAGQQRMLLLGLILLTLCGGAGVYHSILQRRSSLQAAGPLLLALPLLTERSKQVARWTTLLMQLPILGFFAYVTPRSFASISPQHTWTLVIILLPPLLHGWFFGKLFVSAWAEGFGDQLELREHGILVGHRFYDWSGRALRDIRVRKLKPELFVNVRGFRKIVQLTDEQHERAREILANRFTRPRDPSPFD